HVLVIAELHLNAALVHADLRSLWHIEDCSACRRRSDKRTLRSTEHLHMIEVIERLGGKNRRLEQAFPIHGDTCNYLRGRYAQPDAANVHVGRDTRRSNGHARIEELQTVEVLYFLVREVRRTEHVRGNGG